MTQLLTIMHGNPPFLVTVGDCFPNETQPPFVDTIDFIRLRLKLWAQIKKVYKYHFVAHFAPGQRRLGRAHHSLPS